MNPTNAITRASDPDPGSGSGIRWIRYFWDPDPGSGSVVLGPDPGSRNTKFLINLPVIFDDFSLCRSKFFI